MASSEQDEGFGRDLVTLAAPDGDEIPAYLAARFDIEDLLAAPAFAAAGAPDALEHLRVEGPHDLDEPRFDAIVDWVTRAGRARPR